VTGQERLLTSIGTMSSYTDRFTIRGVAYFYKVTAVNSTGEGPLSNEAKATAK
jgi:hypothetical protein